MNMFSEKELLDVADDVNKKLDDTSKTGSWCQAESEALWKLYEACVRALNDGRCKRLLGPPKSEKTYVA